MAERQSACSCIWALLYPSREQIRPANWCMATPSGRVLVRGGKMVQGRLVGRMIAVEQSAVTKKKDVGAERRGSLECQLTRSGVLCNSMPSRCNAPGAPASPVLAR